ncbi:MAG: hypothetical protein J6D42_01645 [Clostridia bacterium]|nr:hypothetical protein [Clostridia bacterium]MBQ2720907.1 hypothetical protein [Clostridia bacterium]
MSTYEIKVKIESILDKLSELKKTISKYVGKRELIIVAIVAVIIFAIVCDKPFSGDYFSMFKPSFWSAQEIKSERSYKITIPEAGSSDSGIELDNVVIKDISDELTDEITNAKEYIISQIDFQVETAMDVFVPKNEVREQVQIFETGRLDYGKGYDAYYFIFTPGGEYSGNKILQVAIHKDDVLISASFRSRWTKFDKNFDQAFDMIKSIRIK